MAVRTTRTLRTSAGDGVLYCESAGIRRSGSREPSEFMPTTVILAGDHRVLREALAAVLAEQSGIEVVGTAAHGAQAVTMVQELHPNVAVLDIGMPKLDGIEAAKAIRRHHPATRVVVLSMHAEPDRIRQALQVGVTGYVLKDAATAELVDAIRAAAGGNAYFSPAVAREVALMFQWGKSGRPPLRPGWDCLTPREREVLLAVVDGKTNVEMAAMFSLSVRTLEDHREHIMRKLRVRNLAELIRFAIRAKVVKP